MGVTDRRCLNPYVNNMSISNVQVVDTYRIKLEEKCKKDLIYP